MLEQREGWLPVKNCRRGAQGHRGNAQIHIITDSKKLAWLTSEIGKRKARCRSWPHRKETVSQLAGRSAKYGRQLES